jgi:hypothetical protein
MKKPTPFTVKWEKWATTDLHQPTICEVLAPAGSIVRQVFEAEPEMTIAAAAFLVGLFAPRHERFCEKVVVACLDAKKIRKPVEKKEKP